MISQPPPPPPASSPGAGLSLGISAAGIAVVAGIVLKIVRFNVASFHGTVSQWDGLCKSTIGEIAQAANPRIASDCSHAALGNIVADVALYGGIAALIAMGVLSSVQTMRRP